MTFLNVSYVFHYVQGNFKFVSTEAIKCCSAQSCCESTNNYDMQSPVLVRSSLSTLCMHAFSVLN